MIGTQGREGIYRAREGTSYQSWVECDEEEEGAAAAVPQSRCRGVVCWAFSPNRPRLGINWARGKITSAWVPKEPRDITRAVMRPGRYEHAGAEPDLTNRGVSGPYKAWVTSSLHVIGREYKTARGGPGGLVSSWPLVRDTPRVRRPCRPVVLKARNVQRRMFWKTRPTCWRKANWPLGS